MVKYDLMPLARVVFAGTSDEELGDRRKSSQ
jgi:hypothetical protein